jgi:hypothetical protein
LSLGLPRSAAHTAPATITEELCHALFGLDDLYETNDLPNYVGPGGLTLISNNAAFPHLHPWGKVKLGWVTPTIVNKDGWYTLRAIEKNPDLLIVHDPKKGAKDYLLIENRWPVGSIEHALPDQGLGLWRISEHFAGQKHWGRKTIQLLRAGGGKDDRVAFFEGSDARTSYHLTPTSSPASSRWVDGSSSNIALYHVPKAGASSRVFVDVPPLRAAPPPNWTPASYKYIDQVSPFRNPSPNWLVTMDLPRIGQTFRVRMPNSFYNGSFTTHFLITGLSNPRVGIPLFQGYLYAAIDTFIAAPSGPVGGMVTIPFPIPNDSGFVGVRFYQQVMRLVGSAGTPFPLSRGGEGRVGN